MSGAFAPGRGADSTTTRLLPGCVLRTTRGYRLPSLRDELASQPWIDRFAFQGEDAEDAFVDAAEGVASDESFEGLDAYLEIPRRWASNQSAKVARSFSIFAQPWSAPGFTSTRTVAPTASAFFL